MKKNTKTANIVKMKINKIVRKIKEKTGFCFYLKEQNYLVDYRAIIKNLQTENNQISVVLPIPPSNEYQQIEKDPILIPEITDIKIDSAFQNKYAIWQFNMQPNSEQELRQEFKIHVMPRKQKPINNTLDNYTKKLLDENKIHLQENNFLKPENKKIAIAAQKIIEDEKDLNIILDKINKFVISYLDYKNPIPGLYSAEQAVNTKEVDCGGFDTFFASMCMSLGIPARIVSGFWAGYEDNKMHAWVEVLLPDGQWYAADPSVEKFRREGRSQKSGKLGFVGSDRVALSVGCDIPVEVNNKIVQLDILQNPYVVSEQGNESFEVEIEFRTKKL